MTFFKVRDEEQCQACEGVGRLEIPANMDPLDRAEVDVPEGVTHITCSDCDGEGSVLVDKLLSLSQVRQLLGLPILIAVLMLSLSACKTESASADNGSPAPSRLDVGPAGPQGPKGDKGDKGDTGLAGGGLDSSGVKTCSYDLAVPPLPVPFRVYFRRAYFTTGDVAVNCMVGNSAYGPVAQSYEMTPASRASSATCSVYVDLGAYSSGLGPTNFGHWTFDMSNQTVTYHHAGSSADGLSYAFVAADCQ